MDEVLAWAGRALVLLAVGYLTWLFMPPVFRDRIERTLSELRARVVVVPVASHDVSL